MRENAHLNQLELAERMGFNQSHISKIELGRQPSASYVIAFARALDIDRSAALAKAGLDDEQVEYSSVELAELRAIFEKLSEEDQRLLISTARAWLKTRSKSKPKEKGKLKPA